MRWGHEDGLSRPHNLLLSVEQRPFPTVTSQRKVMGNAQGSLKMEEGSHKLKNGRPSNLDKGKQTDFCKASRKGTEVLLTHDVIPVRPHLTSDPF